MLTLAFVNNRDYTVIKTLIIFVSFCTIIDNREYAFFFFNFFLDSIYLKGIFFYFVIIET